MVRISILIPSTKIFMTTIVAHLYSPNYIYKYNKIYNKCLLITYSEKIAPEIYTGQTTSSNTLSQSEKPNEDFVTKTLKIYHIKKGEHKNAPLALLRILPLGRSRFFYLFFIK